MSKHTLKNSDIIIAINDLGAELCSIKDASTDTEYLWNADATHWKRHSPILFPIVGGLVNNEFTYKGKTYPMSQHGFARDSVFELISKTETELSHRLISSEESLKVYPFDFILDISYKLEGRKITVSWKVTNPSDKTLYFSIGAHPAFMCPVNSQGVQSDYYIGFDSNKNITYSLLGTGGCLNPTTYELPLENGIVKITEDLFTKDALIIENSQSSRVSVLNPEKKPYVTVTFDAPLFGLWSPASGKAPFVCIEPWYGRCDQEGFTGEFSEKQWMNSLEKDQIFEASYTIEL